MLDPRPHTHPRRVHALRYEADDSCLWQRKDNDVESGLGKVCDPACGWQDTVDHDLATKYAYAGLTAYTGLTAGGGVACGGSKE